MKKVLSAGPWQRSAHHMPIVRRSGQLPAHDMAVVLRSDHYWVSRPVVGFDLDLVYELYLHPDRVETWRRRAVEMLEQQFGNDHDRGVVLSYAGEHASLRRVQAFECERVTVVGHRYLHCLERVEVRPAT